MLSHETGLPVAIVVWHIRSVSPIREMADDNDTITRIAFANGDVVDATETVAEVVKRVQGRSRRHRMPRRRAYLRAPTDRLMNVPRCLAN